MGRGTVSGVFCLWIYEGCGLYKFISNICSTVRATKLSDNDGRHFTGTVQNVIEWRVENVSLWVTVKSAQEQLRCLRMLTVHKNAPFALQSGNTGSRSRKFTNTAWSVFLLLCEMLNKRDVDRGRLRQVVSALLVSRRWILIAEGGRARDARLGHDLSSALAARSAASPVATPSQSVVISDHVQSDRIHKMSGPPPVRHFLRRVWKVTAGRFFCCGTILISRFAARTADLQSLYSFISQINCEYLSFSVTKPMLVH